MKVMMRMMMIKDDDGEDDDDDPDDLQQDVIVAVCSSPALHLSENGHGILATHRSCKACRIQSLSAHRHRLTCLRWEWHHGRRFI